MITSEVTTITPSMAEKWLKENNTHNRPLYRCTIEKYAREMRSGAWAVTNQGIGFAENGTLLDGQQRLSAIVLSNTPTKMLVTRGLPLIFKSNGDGELFTQDAIDGNKPRSTGDILTLSHGLDNANAKMAITNAIVFAIKSQTVPLSPRVAYKIIDLYTDEIEFIISNRPVIRGLFFAPAIAAIVLAAKVDLDKAVAFKTQYYAGTDLTMGSPILTLRNFMLERRSIGSGGSSYRATIMNFSFTALKYHFDGKPLRKLTTSYAGRDFFLGKQKTFVSLISELLN